MINKFKQNNSRENNLYNNIFLLSRKEIFYTKFYLSDTFLNRIHLIFLHISFIFIKIKQNKQDQSFKAFYQKMFDLIFKKIEQNMREVGYGDITVNKNMKFLVKTFYNILLNCENYQNKSINSKNIFFSKHLKYNDMRKTSNNQALIEYFDKYRAFCFDISHDSVLRGELNFIYK